MSENKNTNVSNARQNRIDIWRDKRNGSLREKRSHFSEIPLRVHP